MRKKFCTFIACGMAATGFLKAQFVWTQLADYNQDARTAASAFVLSTGGYVGCGFDSASFRRSFSVYVPASNTWFPVQSLGNANGGGLSRDAAVAFSINNKGYVGTGQGSTPYLNDFWEYNPATDTWTQKANFVGTARRKAVGFATATKGYIGLGQTSTGFRNDLYEYDPVANNWTLKNPFPGSPRQLAVAFVIGTIAYVGSGDDGINKSDFFQFNTATNAWSSIAIFPGTPRKGAAAFSLNGMGYFGTGYDNTLSNVADFWQYNPGTNSWTAIAAFGGGARSNMVAFSIGNYGYAGLGYEGTVKKDFWSYGSGVGFGEDPKALSFSLSPNPLSDLCYVTSGEEVEICRILDLSGRLVREIREPGMQFSIERTGLSSGTYFIELRAGEKKGVKKMVVM